MFYLNFYNRSSDRKYFVFCGCPHIFLYIFVEIGHSILMYALQYIYIYIYIRGHKTFVIDA